MNQHRPQPEAGAGRALQISTGLLFKDNHGSSSQRQLTHPHIFKGPFPTRLKIIKVHDVTVSELGGKTIISVERQTCESLGRVFLLYDEDSPVIRKGHLAFRMPSASW